MSLEDSEILRLYFGQCLLRKNISQTLLLLTGTAGGGKSTLVNIIEGVVGHDNCMNMRLEHINGRFEAGRFQGRSLLTSKDVQSEYLGLDGAFRLKMLTGGDLSNTERKNDNSRLELKGEFNVIIVSNTLLRIMLDNDLEAWRRRILWINYENPPPAERISNFDQRLLLAEGSGILNWALEGAAKLLQDGGLIRRGQVQQIKVDVLLKCARSMETFVQSFVAPMPGCAFTTEEAVASFYELCKHFHWPAMPRRKVEQELKEQMLHCYGVSTRTDIKYGTTKRRGYYGFQIRLPNARV